MNKYIKIHKYVYIYIYIYIYKLAILTYIHGLSSNPAPSI